jgi:hypothetical protein
MTSSGRLNDHSLSQINIIEKSEQNHSKRFYASFGPAVISL